MSGFSRLELEVLVGLLHAEIGRRVTAGRAVPGYLHAMLDRYEAEIRLQAELYAARGDLVADDPMSDPDARATSHMSGAPAPGGRPRVTAPQDLEPGLIPASAAAKQLRMSSRQIRRSHASYDGQLIGDRWFFPADLVAEMAAQRNEHDGHVQRRRIRALRAGAGCDEPTPD